MPVQKELSDLESGPPSVAGIVTKVEKVASISSPSLGGVSSPASINKPKGGNGEEHVLDFNVANFSTPKGKQILHDVAGRTVTGEFTALMGPSGAGKTTLMDCIALRQRAFEGAIHVDGKAPKSDYFTQTGYVHQKEMFFSSLTAREHLVFHSINRLGGKYSKDQCLQRVDAVIKEVELIRCADTIIGGGEFALVKGLSGGERKRLAIGTELLSHPKIIFLDEPTSGLDSVMGELVTGLLSALASGKTGGPRRVIMCVIHTPSSRMWGHFSHVLLLATGGYMAYHGTREALFPYFKSLQYEIPTNYNPADFALEVVSSKPGQEIQGKTAVWVVENFAKRMEKFNRLPCEDNHHHFTGVATGGGTGAGYLLQTKMNVWRAVTQNSRDKATLSALVGMLCILGMVFGLLFLNQAHSSWRNLMGMMFALVVAVLILCSMNVALKFPVEWSIFMREYYTGANALGPYFLGRTIADLPFMSLFLILTIIPYWMAGLTADAGNFLRYCCIFFLIINGAASTGYLASSFSPDPVLGLAITPVIDTPMILFSGMLYERSSVPVYLRWIGEISVVNYGFASLVINECNSIGDGPMRWLVLHFLQIKLEDFSKCVFRLFCLCIGYRVASFCVLKLRVRNTTSL